MIEWHTSLGKITFVTRSVDSFKASWSLLWQQQVDSVGMLWKLSQKLRSIAFLKVSIIKAWSNGVSHKRKVAALHMTVLW